VQTQCNNEQQKMRGMVCTTDALQVLSPTSTAQFQLKQAGSNPEGRL
jgi:hypothetical protein